MRTFIAVVLCVALAGCATTATRQAPPHTGLIDDAAAYVASRFPVASTRIAVAGGDAATVAFEKALRALGFAVDGTIVAAGVPAVSIEIVETLDGALMHVWVDQSRASRAYARDSGGQLAALSPFTVLTTGQEHSNP